MWPWGHLAVGYLAWSLWCRGVYRRPPLSSEAFVVVVGSQFPDLVDKTLAWSFSVLSFGRSLAHSTFTFVFVSAAAIWLARRYDRPTLGVAFAVAYASHLLSDALQPILRGNFHRLGYLLWPITPAPRGEGDSILMALQSVSFGDFAGYHGLAILLYLVVWILDGLPGVPRRSTRER